MNDAEAVTLLHRGGRRAVEFLLGKYQMSVYTLSLRMLGNPQDAEDATQEVFLRAFQRAAQYRPDQPFGAWLYGIARHHAIDVLRRRRSESAVPESLAAPDNVESQALATLDRERVQAALTRLAGRDRALLVLRYWEDQPVGEIARSMRMSEGATRVALLRARRALGAILTAEVPDHAL